MRRWGFAPFCAACPARHAVVASLARTLGLAIQKYRLHLPRSLVLPSRLSVRWSNALRAGRLRPVVRLLGAPSTACRVPRVVLKTEHRVFGTAVDSDALRNQDKSQPSYASVISRDAINFGGQFMVSAPRQQRSSGVHSPTAVAATGENRGCGDIHALHAVEPQKCQWHHRLGVSAA